MSSVEIVIEIIVLSGLGLVVAAIAVGQFMKWSKKATKHKKRVSSIRNELAETVKNQSWDEPTPEPEKVKPTQPRKKKEKVDLSGMTKKQLIEFADSKGIKVIKSKKKADLITDIESGLK